MTSATKTVATLLEQELTPTIQRWMKRVDAIPELTKVSLSYNERTGHLPQLIEDLITRLRLEDGSQTQNHLSPRPRQCAVSAGVLRPDAGRRVAPIASEPV